MICFFFPFLFYNTPASAASFLFYFFKKGSFFQTSVLVGVEFKDLRITDMTESSLQFRDVVKKTVTRGPETQKHSTSPGEPPPGLTDAD